MIARRDHAEPEHGKRMPCRVVQRPASCDATIRAKASGATAIPLRIGDGPSWFCINSVITS